MLSRTCVVKGEGRRTALTLPPPPDPEEFGLLVQLLNEVRQLKGVMRFTPEAFDVIDILYKSEHPLSGTRFDTFVGRRHVQLYKLCIILTALDLELSIKPETVIFANTLLHEIELAMPSALGEFGLSETNAKSNAILRLIESQPLTIDVIWKELSGDFKNRQEFQEIISKLKQTGKIDSNDKLKWRVCQSSRNTVALPLYQKSLLDYRLD
jgi:hypothetical protein